MKVCLWRLFIFALLTVSIAGCDSIQSKGKESITNKVVEYELEDLNGYWFNAENGDFLYISQESKGIGEMTIRDSGNDLIYSYDAEQPEGHIIKLLVTNEMTGTEVIDEPYKLRLVFEGFDTIVKVKNGDRLKYIRSTAVAFEKNAPGKDSVERKIEEGTAPSISNEPPIEERLVGKASDYFDSIGGSSSILKLYPSEWEVVFGKRYYAMPFGDGNRVTTIYGDSEGSLFMEGLGEELVSVEVEQPFSESKRILPLDIWVLSQEFKESLEKGIMPGSAVQLDSNLEDMKKYLGSPQEVNENESNRYYHYDYHSFQLGLGKDGEEVITSIGWGYSERLHIEVNNLFEGWGRPDGIEEDMFQAVPSNNYIYELNDAYLFKVITAGTDDESPIITVSYSRK